MSAERPLCDHKGDMSLPHFQGGRIADQKPGSAVVTVDFVAWKRLWQYIQRIDGVTDVEERDLSLKFALRGCNCVASVIYRNDHSRNHYAQNVSITFEEPSGETTDGIRWAVCAIRWRIDATIRSCLGD